MPIEIEVRDGRGAERRATLSFHAHERPVVAMAELPPTCPDEIYDVELEARGGDPSTYRWSTDLPVESGLEIDGMRLSGRLTPAAAAEFNLVVEDDYCRSEPAPVVLHVETALACPEIGISPPWDFSELPEPCHGNPYRVALLVRRGDGAPSWSSSEMPDGLELDAAGVISGTARAPGVAAVRATTRGRTIERRYTVSPRDACWFGYLAGASGQTQLQLTDPVLDAVFASRLTIPAPPATEPVLDFRFAPGGRFLAYRLGPADSARLMVARAPTWRIQTVELAGPVLSYAWSPDGAALAVASRSGAGTVLGGLDFSQVVAATEGEAGPAIPGVRALDTTPAAIDSELVWFSERHVAFGATDPDVELDYLSHARLEGSAFTAPASSSLLYLDRYRLVSGDRGLFVADPGVRRSYFVPIQDGNAPVSHEGVVVSPRGKYTGRAVDGELQVFSARERALQGDSPELTGARCDALLSWAAGRERIACALERDGVNAPIIYDLSGEELVPLAALRGPFSYPAGSERERRRLFSPSGRWFAFTTDDYTYFVDLADGTPFVRDVSVDPPTPPNSYLEFSPDETLLLEQRGTRLAVHHLSKPRLDGVSTQLAAATPCVEEFARGPASWCGGQELGARLAWSPDSTLVAYRTASGALELYSMPSGEVMSVDDTCAADCAFARWFAFQPAPPTPPP